MIATENVAENTQLTAINESLKQYNLEVVAHRGNNVFATLESPTFDPASLKEIAQSLANDTNAHVTYSKNIGALSQSKDQSGTDKPDQNQIDFNLDSTKGLKAAITFLRQSLEKGDNLEDLKTKIETVIQKKIGNPSISPSAPVDFLRQAVEALQAGILHYGEQKIHLTPAEIEQIKNSVDIELANHKQMLKNTEATNPSRNKSAAENLAFAQLDIEDQENTIHLLLFPNAQMARIASRG